jgi:alanyl-tRNA synthetase
VVEEKGEILHLISINESNEAPLKPGKAELALDWRRRRDFTVIHTGQHLLSGILFSIYKIPTVSAHLGDEVCFIDIDSSEIINRAELNEEKLIEIEEAVMDGIEKNHPVITHLCPPEDVGSFPLRKLPPKNAGITRIVEIEGVDFSPCCGTHLKSTREIGMLRVLGAEKYKAMTRLSFIAGRRCLYDSRRLRKNAEVVSRALSVPLGEIGQGVLDFVERTRSLEEELKVFKEKDLREKAETLVKQAGLSNAAPGLSPAVVVESYSSPMNEVIYIGKIAQKLCPGILVLVSEPENKFAAFCGDKEIDLRLLFKERLEALGGKGGGGPSFFQGSFSSGKDLEAFIKLCHL